MRQFIDERFPAEILTEQTLYAEYKENSDKDASFYQYINNCLSKNGTLTEIEGNTDILTFNTFEELRQYEEDKILR